MHTQSARTTFKLYSATQSAWEEMRLDLRPKEIFNLIANITPMQCQIDQTYTWESMSVVIDPQDLKKLNRATRQHKVNRNTWINLAILILLQAAMSRAQAADEIWAGCRAWALSSL